MIKRLYVVKMPTSVPTTALDILVTNNPGTQSVPVVAGGDGAYYEWRGRPLRVPNPSGTTGFVPRFRLGFAVSIAGYGAADVTDLPGFQLSASLASVSSTDAGPTISVPTFADPSGKPALRLVGGGNTAGQVYLVTLLVMEPKDDDRDPNGVGG